MSIQAAFETFPQIETRDLVLRRILPNDAGALFGVLSNPEVTEFYDDDAFTDVEQALDQIEAWERAYRNRYCLRWAITRKTEGALIGTCGMYALHAYHQKASIGYELGREYWRQGIMTEALGGLLAYGFSTLGLNRLDALVMPGNTASIRLLAGLGFRSEGLQSAFERWGDKGFVDLNRFAILKIEWEGSFNG